jgi:hypothetical protein
MFFIIITSLLLLGCPDDATHVDNTSSGTDGSEDINTDFNPNFDMGHPDMDLGTDESTVDLAEETVDLGPPSTLGVDCFTAVECDAGQYCIGADAITETAGYCTILECGDSSECAFGTEDVFCCSNFGVYRGCFMEEPGSVCGDESGEQGDDCSQGGQSDCYGESHYCIDFYDERICSQSCLPGIPESCPEGNWCLDIGDGGGLCLPGGDYEAGDNCAEDPFLCSEGLFCDGAFSEPIDPYSFCAEGCDSDADCSGEYWCRIYFGGDSGTCLPYGDGEQSDSCAEDRWSCGPSMLCINSNTKYAACAGLCEEEEDCERDSYCWFFSDDTGLCLAEGTRDTGESCGDNPAACYPYAACVGGWGTTYNVNAFCADECTDNAGLCGESFSCEPYEENNFCAPDGDAGIRGDCDSPLDCPLGTLCAYGGSGVTGLCAPYCMTDTECLDSEWCSNNDDEAGVCLFGGDTLQGYYCGDDLHDCESGSFCSGDGPYCISECTLDENLCASGTHCSEPNDEGRRYCIPTGTGIYGSDCENISDCSEETFCGWNFSDSTGFCSTSCTEDSECPSGSECFYYDGGSICLLNGSLEALDGCAGSDRFSCGSGLTCLNSQTEEAICHLNCSGFPDLCEEDQVCRYTGLNHNFCWPLGDTEKGGSCVEDPFSCDASSHCINAGHEDALCAEICTFDTDGCDDEETCHTFMSGFAVCLPSDYSVDGLSAFTPY